ncbi:MAG: gliding motility-associated C-terminal domain-containing protein [Anaerolineae bacterium]
MTDSLLAEVSVNPPTISPNADGLTDVTRISYRLNRSADLSIYLVDEVGERHYFRQSRRRSIGDYQVDFSGVVDGAMLPNGAYTWVVEAVADDGQTANQQGQLVIQEADTSKPELQGFSVYPKIFTPNQDGIDDRVTINYYLTKQAQVSVYLIAADGETKYPIAEKEREIKPGEPGLHTYDYEGGVDMRADPPPDGLYTVRAEAVDRVGNRTILTDSLTIAEGGVPRADIVSADVDFYNPASGDQVVPLGATLAFTLTIENNGKVPIRTTGPTSGTSYRSDENFNTKGFYESAGVWRVGIDYEGNPSYAYPYRWAVGNLDELEKRFINNNTEYYLMPGQRAIVTGAIQIVDVPADRNSVDFWAGLIHEQVRVANDHVDPTPITIGF